MAPLPLTEGNKALRRKLKYFIPFFTAPISLCSSIYLVYSILKQGKRAVSTKPKEQLLLGLSLLDICGSFAYSFSTTPAPYWINSPYPTYGNERTCSAQGFLAKLRLGVPVYNACICIYFLLTVRYKVNKSIIKKWVLPSMHLGVFFFSFGTATVALAMGWYHFNGILGCSVNSKEQWHCYCDYGEGRTKEGWTFAYVGDKKTWGCYGEATCDFEWGLSSTCASARDNVTSVVVRCVSCEICHQEVVSTQTELFELLAETLPVTLCFFIVVISMMMLYRTVRHTELTSQRWHFKEYSSAQTRGTTTANESSRGLSRSSGSPRKKSQVSARHRSSVLQGSLATLSQRTMETGILYSGALLLVYLPTGLTSLIPTKSKLHVPVQVMVVTLLTLQGFFNLLIYTSADWLPIVERWKMCRCLCGVSRRIGSICSNPRTEQDQNSRYPEHSPARSNLEALEESTREVPIDEESTTNGTHLDDSSRRDVADTNISANSPTQLQLSMGSEFDFASATCSTQGA
jgi:hypothetical protein